jgi:hypothetical protein
MVAALSPMQQPTLARLCTLLACVSRMQGGRGCAAWTCVPVPGGPCSHYSGGAVKGGAVGGPMLAVLFE